MTHLILIEDVPAGFSAATGDSLLAVTATAVAALEALGLEHLVLADVVDERLLASAEDEHFDAQLTWLDLLDDMLRARVPELEQWDPGLPYFYSYFLKTLLDTVFIRGFEARGIASTAPERVTLVRKDAEEAPLDDTLYFRGPSLLSRLLPRFCARAGIPYDEVLSPSSPMAPSVSQPGVQRPRRKIARPLVDRIVGAAASLAPQRKTIAFVSTLYDAGEVLRRARRRGHRCLLVHDDVVDDLARVRSRAVADLTTRPPRWTSVADELTADDSPLWEWPDSWHGVEVRDVLASRLHYFLENVAPALLADATRLRETFDEFGVDFVINPYLVHVREGAAAAATRLSQTAESVVIEHGDAVFAAKEIDLALLLCFDHVFVGNAELASYYAERRRAHARRTAEVHLGSYRWPAVERNARGSRGESPAPISGERPVAVYVVTASGGDLRYLNSAWYSDAWYYRLQARIVDTLGRREDYDVIVKTFPGGGNVESPLDAYARNLGLTVSDVPFLEWLPFADRVVVDFPSTAFYECALARVPALGLLHDHFHVRRSALDEFGGSLVPFSTAGDAVAIVDGFLSAGEWPVPHLVGRKQDIVETLEQL